MSAPGKRGSQVLLTSGLILGLYGTALAAAPTVGAPADVASKVEGTKLQKWPRAAWAEQSKCWLVAWREGDIVEQDSEIWCARVGADGVTMDPAGIRITSAIGIQDYPVVASDGKGFLVAWNDFRNGKDWDVYAARVSGDPAKAGQAAVLDADGFLVAGGAHSQCQPAVVFAGRNYLVAWQGFLEDVMHLPPNKTKGLQPMKFGSYEVRGTRVSPEGKVLDAGGNTLAAATAIQPCFASDGNGGLWIAFVGFTGKEVSQFRPPEFPAMVRIDAAKCATQGGVSQLGHPPGRKSVEEFGGGGVPLSVVWTKDRGGLLAGRGYLGGTTLFGFDAQGKAAGDGIKMQNRQFRLEMLVSSLAVDGDRILLIRDRPLPGGGKKAPRLGVWGWLLSPNGQVMEGGETGFPIAVEEGKDRMQGFACAGPAGTFLVVCSEARGVEDTKVVARLVK